MKARTEYKSGFSLEMKVNAKTIARLIIWSFKCPLPPSTGFNVEQIHQAFSGSTTPINTPTTARDRFGNSEAIPGDVFFEWGS